MDEVINVNVIKVQCSTCGKNSWKLVIFQREDGVQELRTICSTNSCVDLYVKKYQEENPDEVLESNLDVEDFVCWANYDISFQDIKTGGYPNESIEEEKEENENTKEINKWIN